MNRDITLGAPAPFHREVCLLARCSLALSLCAFSSVWADAGGGFQETGAIIFASERDESPTDIYLVDANGDSVRRVTNHDRPGRLTTPNWKGVRWGGAEVFGFFPSGSGDGQPTQYEMGGFQVSVTAPMHRRNRPVEDTRSSLSHTVPAIEAYHLDEGDGFNIYVREWNSEEKRGLTDQPNSFHPEWSPDSRSIAFLSDRFGDAEVFSMDRDGQELVRLAPGVEGHRPVWAWKHGHGAISSGEAGLLAFLGSSEGGPLDVYVVGRDGSGLANVSRDPVGVEAFCWSWEGTQIAFNSKRDGNTEIYVADIDGTELRNVTNHPADDLHFSWIDTSTIRALFEAAGATNEQLIQGGIDPALLAP